MSRKPVIAVTMGDPGGIGPEVIVQALCDRALTPLAKWIVIGSPGVLATAAESAGLGQVWSWLAQHGDSEAGGVRVIDHPTFARQAAWPARPDPINGRASLDYLNAALAFVKGEPGPITAAMGPADGVVTGPICKEAWVLAGERRYPGHTELFAEAFASPDAAMMFIAEPVQSAGSRGTTDLGLNVILATAHLPLSRVQAVLSTAIVLNAITQGAETLRQLGHGSPRIGVCGLNPHAGEQGVLGHEDESIIAPAVREARRQGLDVTGPHPGDTIFPGALSRANAPAPHHDLVVAMYHDQGLIPVKLLAFDRAVNLTTGLSCRGRPIVRTSPDHGTAFDIAGRGLADAGSMKAALRLAVRCARAHRPLHDQ